MLLNLTLLKDIYFLQEFYDFEIEISQKITEFSFSLSRIFIYEPILIQT